MPARADELCRMGARQPRFRGVPARRGEVPAGRPRRPHAAEHARLSGDVPRHAARGPDGRQRQSAVHGARTERAARGFRRRGHRDPGEFRAQAGNDHRRDASPPRRGRPARRFCAHAQALGIQSGELVPQARGARLALRDIHDAAGRLQPQAERALRGCRAAGDCGGAAAIYRRNDRAWPKARC